MSNKGPIQTDLGKAFDLLGRLFTSDEPMKRVLGLEGSAPAPAAEARAVEPGENGQVRYPGKEESCATCGTAPDGDLADRVITRKDKKTIPCPGCLGRK